MRKFVRETYIAYTCISEQAQLFAILEVVGALVNEAQRFTIPEVLAVLAHELGHWKHHHVLKKALIAEARLFITFGLFAVLRHHQALYSAFGFVSERPTFVGFIIVQHVAALLNLLVEFASKRLDWRHEFAADAFAVGLGRGADLATGLLKYARLFPRFPIFDTLYATFHQSHPPILHRVAAIADADENEED
jgi:STE24 endopeptidase